MIVKELIEKLSKCDPDAPVLVYIPEDTHNEDDFDVLNAREVYPEIEDEDTEDPVYNPPYYCQGWGIAGRYWRDNGPNYPVVLIDLDC